MRSLCELWAWLWSLDAHGWVAISTFLLVLATVTLVVVGVLQVSSIRKEAKTARTLAMCDRYDTDPVLDRCVRALNKAKAAGGDFSENPGNYADEVSTVLNYFDSLAIGIERGLYDESLAHVHNRDILSEYVEGVSWFRGATH
jgi:hypothetical protein